MLQEEIRSKLWFTYRKQFLPIGDSGLTSDSGWGCMHRCGQMLMGQAFIWRYLKRDWTWKPNHDDEIYQKILWQFNDKIECQYSIHKIAIKGNLLEKQVGQWFGPNTVVQVMKRLAEEDTENDIAIHVAMDNMVIKNELRKLFRRSNKNFQNIVSADTLPASSNILDSSCDQGGTCLNENSSEYSESNSPVLLTIPLRLGLSEIIPVYYEKLKAVFTLKQSLGIIGGRTNHASYFIGYVGNELIYLDPHTTQLHRNEPPLEDKTYHCEHPSRMTFSQLDPSIALCFYLENETGFEQWCKDAHQVLLEPEKDALFEILEEKPPMLPYVDIDVDDDFNVSLNEMDRVYTSDNEFELLM
ncbi:cysteine protease ATG4B-like isoform X1 [Stegodyphus dumicola]|uniref:cysteine protease ATG4B-like isoform X1 n=1 Tax=Stegodyphus dumicola TaxID=202533 RepID=UPI0015AF7791|nr:cysteine protease ATG4B-like isoform X1 [Stegodyphus dumicola]